MKKTWIIVVVALALVLSSCNFPFAQDVRFGVGHLGRTDRRSA